MRDAAASVLAAAWWPDGEARKIPAAPFAEGHPGNTGRYAVGYQEGGGFVAAGRGRTWEEAFHRADPVRWRREIKRAPRPRTMRDVVAEAKRRGNIVERGGK